MIRNLRPRCPLWKVQGAMSPSCPHSPASLRKNLSHFVSYDRYSTTFHIVSWYFSARELKSQEISCKSFTTHGGHKITFRYPFFIRLYCSNYDLCTCVVTLRIDLNGCPREGCRSDPWSLPGKYRRYWLICWSKKYVWSCVFNLTRFHTSDFLMASFRKKTFCFIMRL